MLGARASVSYVKGIHNIKVGVNYEHTFLTEKDTFGIVDPTANAVCLNADGSPVTGPLADRTRPAARARCQPNPGFHSAAGLLRPDQNRHAAGLRRLPEFHQRPV